MIHSFEPVSPIFEKLKFNCELNNLISNVFLNNLALGLKEEKTVVNLFRGLPSGHASISTLGREDYADFEIDIISLDRYILDNNISKVDLVKCDVEGAEMMVIRGGKQLFSCKKAPILCIELPIITSKYFGYTVRDLLLQLSEYGYSIFRIGKGNNSLCFPRSRRINSIRGLNVIDTSF